MTTNTKLTATDRVSELMATKIKDVPPLATKFARHLGEKMGLCGEVYVTAYAIYAQCVEGLPCDDPDYVASPLDIAWFRSEIEENLR